MINKSVKLRLTYLSQTDGASMIELELPEEFKEEDWPRKFKKCQAVFQPERGKLVITCQTETRMARKSWLQILGETGGYFW